MFSARRTRKSALPDSAENKSGTLPAQAPKGGGLNSAQNSLSGVGGFKTTQNFKKGANLNENNKISLYVRYINIADGTVENRMFNKNA